MAAFEVLALDPTTPQIRAPGAADTYSFPRAITPSGANVTPFTLSGYSLTGANAQSMFDLSGTWNTTGTPTGIKFNVTDTASNAASLLMDLQRGGVTQFAVQKDAGGYVVDGAYGLRRTTNVAITITGGTTGGASIDLNGTFVSLNRIVLNRASQDCGIARKAAGVTEINNGTAGTYAGTAFTTGSQTVAQLPAANSAGAGARAFVTDATATTFLSTVAGGGANAVPVVSNGTNWLIG